MDIRNVSVGLNATERIRQEAIDGPEKPLTPSTAPAAGETTAATSDRVDLSGALSANSAPPAEVQFAQKALHSLPPLSAERLAEIQQRMESGYHQDPDVQRTIVDRLADEALGTKQQP